MRILSVLLSLAALSAFGSPSAAQETPRKGSSAETEVKITVSKETTYLLGPLRVDGTVDYAAALNARLGKGVTPENNAAIPLLRAIGPGLLVEASRAEVLRRLGMPSLPEKARDLRLADGTYRAWPGGWEPESQKALEAPWAAKDYPTMAAWLKANEGRLALVVEATKRPRLWIPLPEGKEGWPLAVYLGGPVGGIVRALVARAMGRLHSGDIAGAWADLRAGHRLARLIARHPDTSAWMSGLDGQVGQGVATLAKSRGITVSEAKAFLSDLRTLPPLPSFFEVLDEFERLETLEAITALAHAPKPDWKVMAETSLDAPGLADLSASEVDWDEALRTVNRWFDRLVAVRGKASFAGRRDALDLLDKELRDLKARARQTLRPENVRTPRRAARDPAPARSTLGRAIGTLLYPEWATGTNMLSKTYRLEAHFRVTEAALALAGYRAETGGFPARLEDLKPGYLPDIPKDPFVDRPLSYQRRGRGYVLYSVGPDGKPDKAAGAQSGDDIVLRAE